MPISDQTIIDWEQRYGVDIDYDPENGNFTVESLRTSGPFWEAAHPDHTTYRVSGRILDDQIAPDADYSRAVGVDLTGDTARDFGNINRALFEDSGGMDALNNVDADFTSTHLHRVAVVAGALRTDGQIPPEAWAQDRSFGGAGAGADILPGGGQGGVLSEIGIQHDIDIFLGGHGYGPMAELNDVVAVNNRIPSGLHGLGPATEQLARHAVPDAWQQLQDEQRDFPDTTGLPDYVTPELYPTIWTRPPDGWGSTKPAPRLDPEDRQWGPEGPDRVVSSNHEEAREALHAFNGYVEAGGDPEVAMEYLKRTEDNHTANPELDIARDLGSDGHDVLHSSAYEPAEQDNDYGLV